MLYTVHEGADTSHSVFAHLAYRLVSCISKRNGAEDLSCLNNLILKSEKEVIMNHKPSAEPGSLHFLLKGRKTGLHQS